MFRSFVAGFSIAMLFSLADNPLLAQAASTQAIAQEFSGIESLRYSATAPQSLRDSLALEPYLAPDDAGRHVASCRERSSRPFRIRHVSLALPGPDAGWAHLEVVQNSADSSAPTLPMIVVRRAVGDGPQLEAAVMFGAFLRIERRGSRSDRSAAVEMFPLADPLTEQLEQLARAALAMPCATG